ncbi:inhibitor of KinA sporulation pathway (predicted exonuclease) [Natranaerovirga pectinivora]|uniref:Inhibitor of KinA sporulation pathway (Predicted exonuclease) n=1 Tax=Natranaerovirga pectinivora TaxID=682400 RepID=A0A4R3MPE7_9FIRM|nr:exonuclease domain-containing protein [Natranaerovirga pectinivora]TCT17177.1 inhibitor of KinA sporulation pathway (predicted exonuclease) [Natranaerovirga pectinivora]
MYYLIFDLEFNQAFGEALKNPKNEKCPFEIIQIGAYKLDEALQEVGTFDAIIKPTLYPKMHPFIGELTNIKQEQLDMAKPFKEIFQDFLEFIGDTENIYCVWGMGDLKELYRNVIFHGFKKEFHIERYINIQRYASKHFQLPSGNLIGLRNAVEFLNIPIDKSLHDAFNDAYFTKEVFKILEINKMKPKIYSYNLTKTTIKRKPKKKINYKGLIAQFEKMYDREISEEEKAIIILAFKMGMTGQFQKIDKPK